MLFPYMHVLVMRWGSRRFSINNIQLSLFHEVKSPNCPAARHRLAVPHPLGVDSGMFFPLRYYDISRGGPSTFQQRSRPPLALTLGPPVPLATDCMPIGGHVPTSLFRMPSVSFAEAAAAPASSERTAGSERLSRSKMSVGRNPCEGLVTGARTEAMCRCEYARLRVPR